MLLAHFWKCAMKLLRRVSNVNLCSMAPRYTSGWCGTLQRPQIPAPGPPPQVNPDVAITGLLQAWVPYSPLPTYWKVSWLAELQFPHQELNLGLRVRAQNPNHSLGHQGTPRQAWPEGECRKPYLLPVCGSLPCWIAPVTVSSRGLSIPHGEVIHVHVVVAQEGECWF